MTKITVENVAKELNVEPSVVKKKLEEIGVFVPTYTSVLRPDEYARVKSLITGKKIRMVRKKVAKPGASSKAQAAPQTAAKPAQKPAAKTSAVPGSAAASAKTEQTASAAASQPAVKTASPVSPAASSSASKPVQPSSAPVQSEGPLTTVSAAPSAQPSPAAADNAMASSAPASSSAKTPAAKTPAASSASKPAASAGSGRVSSGSTQNSVHTQRDSHASVAHTQTRTQTSRTGYAQNRGTYSSGRNTQSRPSAGRTEGSRPYQGKSDASRTGSRPQGQAGSFAPRSSRNAGTRRPSGNFRRPAGRGGNDSYDMGLSAPERKTENKEIRKNQEHSRKDRQKNTALEEYKSRKKSLIEEANYLDDDSLARHKKKPVKRPQASQAKPQEEDISIVELPDSMTVKEFADALHKPINVIIKALMAKGIMASLNHVIDFDTAEEIAAGMDILVEHQKEEDIFEKYANFQDDDKDLVSRPPVVVVMGHVDHGKTSLLDAIRHTNVTQGEAGGITQHIGASVVTINGRKITFLDTPGHEAFTAMRLRGAMVTDIAILVVAADDGVMPQTIEAINHAKAAGVQIIVAINKIDKPGANPERVKEELTEYGLVAEDWGGSTICCEVSATKKIGIDNLLEMVLLSADMLDLKANPNALASGTVVESELDKGRGAVATVLVQRGTLHVGDTIVAGSTFGRIKAMVDSTGRRVKTAGPSTPVEIIGLSEVPTAGDHFYMTETEREARELSEKVSARERRKMIEGNKKVNLNDLFGDIQSGEVKELNIIVKADVQGSVEAVKQSLEKLSNDQVKVSVIHGAVGAITESDVMLASASNSIIIGFNVRPDSAAKSMAEEQKVDIRLYRIIYNAIDDITAAMKGMLAPVYEEKVEGHAEIRQIFHASGVGTIGGCYVTDGKITRNSKARLVRDGIVVHEGELSSLRRFKDDVKEVASGYECGIMFDKYNDLKEGDTIEAFTMEEIKKE